MDIDVDQLSAELLRALRGPRSQVAFSRRLGYRSNVAAAWEGRRRWPTASRMLQAARTVGVDVDAGLQRFYRLSTPTLNTVDPASPEGVAAFLRDHRRIRTLDDLSERTGYSRHQLSRWYRGAAQPRLPELLSLVEASTQRLLDYIAILVDPTDVACIAREWSQLEAARSLFWRMPHAQLVLVAVNLLDYRALPAHDDQWLAARLGLQLYQVTGAVEALVATGQLRWEDRHLAFGRVQTLDTRRHPEAPVALRRYWNERALEHVECPSTSWSWNTFTVSEADRDAIVDLYRSTYRKMRAIVAASEPSETVVLVQQSIVQLDTPPASLRRPGTSCDSTLP
ncbi:MAG: DUF4423 domain-containing protein [Myxococcales bacterium]|nr:DUF4423 domain-containing protein [Myxococcales bacterium]